MANEKRLIDANALSDLLDVEYKRKMKLVRKGEEHLDTLAEGIMSVSILLGTMSTVDAVEVVHGHWCWEGRFKACSKCGSYVEFTETLGASHWKYCPYCGAKMDGENESGLLSD